jgi:hypothetical protein
MERLSLNQVLSHVDQNLQSDLYCIIQSNILVLFIFILYSIQYPFLILIFFNIANDIDGLTISTMEQADIAVLFDSIKVKLQFNKIKAKLNETINSDQIEALYKTLSSIQAPPQPNDSLTATTTVPHETATPVKSTASSNWPSFFSFPIEKASFALKDHLNDTDVCPTDLTFLKDVVDLLYNKIKDLNM